MRSGVLDFLSPVISAMELFSLNTCFSRVFICLNMSLVVGDGFDFCASHSSSYSSSCSCFIVVSDWGWLGVLGSPFPEGIPPWLRVPVDLGVSYLVYLVVCL